MERKLATIRRINKIEPIKDADKIELAHIDGWQCIIGKGEFTEGDYAVYFEIDSLLPLEDRYKFLEKMCPVKTNADGSIGYRIKTMKMRGVLSQGLLMPFSAFGDAFKSLTIGNAAFYASKFFGGNVTPMLGVKLYAPPIPACISGYAKGFIPSFIRRTNQERIENHPEYFELYKDILFEVTEKLDGTSITYYWNKGEFGVCSHNLELKDNDNTPWQIARRLRLPERLEAIGANMALQGELIGAGIQSNHYKIKGQQWYLFDIWDIEGNRYLSPDVRETMMQKLCDVFGDNVIQHVPFISTMSSNIGTLEFLLNKANRNSALNKDVRMEGMVYKSEEHIDGEIISFKVLNNNYLLKE